MNKLDLYKPNLNKRPYVLSILIAVDQLANAIIGGWPDETISSRAHREEWKKAEKFIDTLFWFDKQGDIGHCELSYLGELVREHFPVDRGT
jgi:hypothetical protein